MSYEEMLHSHSSTGAIFALKNMGWHDTVKQDISLKEQPLFPNED